eukprot:2234156-Pyramimonas_sp.AAC.1
MAALYGWKLWPTDISMAFLRGKTFKQIANETGAKLRSIQCDLPAGANALLRQIEDFHDFSEISEVLDMNMPGFGTNDAPWSWSMALAETMIGAQWAPSRADKKLYAKRRQATERDSYCPIKGKKYTTKDKIPLGILATHVDDFKEACEDRTIVKLLQRLEVEYGKCELNETTLECVGIKHAQNPKTMECTMDQSHYVSQLNAIPMEKVKDLKDDERANDEL